MKSEGGIKSQKRSRAEVQGWQRLEREEGPLGERKIIYELAFWHGEKKGQETEASLSSWRDSRTRTCDEGRGRVSTSDNLY